MTGTASRNLHTTAVQIRKVPRSGMVAAVKAVKRVAGEEASRVGPVRVWRKRAKSYRTVKRRAYDDIRDRGDDVNARIQGVPVGPWVWANTGARRHVIGARRSGRRAVQGPGRVRDGVVLSFGPDQLARGPVVHPGTRGRGAWRKVRRRSEDIVPRIFRDEVKEVIRG